MHRFALAALLLLLGADVCTYQVLADRAQVGGPTDPQGGKAVAIDLPREQHLKNLSAGGGCCVFASADMAARWARIKPLIGILDDRLGGGWPEKVDREIARRYPGFSDYTQAEGSLTEPLIDWAIRTRRIPCVTYGYGERYGRNISHMVILLHCDPASVQTPRCCVQDCNFPGSYEWMSRAEFFRRHRLQGAWAFAFWCAPPPPVPVN